MLVISKKKRQIDSVYLIGCGGSLATYYPAKYLLETEAKTLKIAAYTSNEFVHATPKGCGEHSIAVACSLRGTPETVEAMRVARACGRGDDRLYRGRFSGWRPGTRADAGRGIFRNLQKLRRKRRDLLHGKQYEPVNGACL